MQVDVLLITQVVLYIHKTIYVLRLNIDVWHYFPHQFIVKDAKKTKSNFPTKWVIVQLLNYFHQIFLFIN